MLLGVGGANETYRGTETVWEIREDLHREGHFTRDVKDGFVSTNSPLFILLFFPTFSSLSLPSPTTWVIITSHLQAAS